MIIRMTLEEDYEFSEAGDGEEAWKKFDSASPPYDLVILDLTMPGLEGSEILERILLKQPDAAVILLTGRLDFQLKENRPRVRVMRKPFDNSELADSVAELLGS